MKISTTSTYTDWADAFGAGGLLGIERIMDWLKSAGIKTLYWRAFGGGNALYPSRVASRQVYKGTSFSRIGKGGGPINNSCYQHLEFNNFDPLREAVRMGKARGIEVHAWFTICEEDHGGDHGSRFGSQKRFRLHDRDGRDYPGTIEFFYPEVRKYKLALLDELLERDVAGVMLDFARCNATARGDSRGIHRFGYNPEIRKAFQSEHGVDPTDLANDDKRWLSYKQQYIGAFVRSIKSKLRGLPLSVMAVPDVDNKTWACLDLPTLTREGTIQHVAAFGMSYDRSQSRTVENFQQLRSQVAGKATVAAGLQAYDNDGLDPQQFEDAVEAAREAGAKELTLHEADSLIGQGLLASVRAIHLNATRASRNVNVARLAASPDERAWKNAHASKGFFTVFGPDRLRPAAETSFSILSTSKHLHVRVYARGKQGVANPDADRVHGSYIQWLGDRHWSLSDRVHLFIDPGATRRDFVHFLIGRDGVLLQGKRAGGKWSPAWTGKVSQSGLKCWIGEFEIPFSALGRKPRKGERWGFQIIREQAAEREASGWFVSAERGYTSPLHWGDMIFE